MIVPGPRPLWLAGLWLWAAAATLLPSGPGYALLLNGRSNTEFAYSYPRRLAPQFTLEMWLTGFAQDSNHVAPISISHPRDATVFSLTDRLTLLGVPVIAPLGLPTLYWYHLAVSVDLSAHPAYDVRVYVNGTLNATAVGRLPASGLTPADLEEDTMSLVLGQEQAAVLGPFRPLRSFTGLVDDLRVWAVVRSAAEVAAWHSRTLTPPYPAGLVSYYNFDDDDWDATYYQDNVNVSEQRRLYCADYANASTAPTPPPAYAPPLTPLPRLGLSWAPLCSTTAGLTSYRVGSRGWVAVPITSLYCSDTDDVVTATVTAVSGGSLLTDDYSNALWLPQPSQFTLWFMAYSNGYEDVEPGSGFNYTLTDGTATAEGFLSILPNHLPSLFTELDLVTAEDVRLDSWIVATDEDRDVVTVRVQAGPGHGRTELDPFVQRTLSYTPPANANGANVGMFTLVACDWWVACGKVMAVNVSVTPITDPPQILIDSNFAVYRGQRINVPFQVVDVDGADPVVVLTDWPAASQGRLEAQDGGRRRTLNESSVLSKVVWASSYSQTSSSSNNTTAGPWAGGMQDCDKENGDCTLAWAPASEKSCNNLCGTTGLSTTFCSEFFEAKFDTPLFLTTLTLWEEFGGNRVSRIRVPSDRDPSQWTVILEKDAAKTPGSSASPQYSVTRFPVCPAFWPVDTVRVEIDTCHGDGWYQVDAVQMRGSLVAANNVLNGTARLAFQAARGYTGPVEFSLVATSCYGSPNATSAPVTIRLLVIDTPNVMTVTPMQGWFPIDVGQLNAGPLRGNVVVLELPSAGTLQYGTQVLDATQEDLVYTSTLFQYKAFRCDSSLTDMFIVELGPTAVVQVNVRGCSATTEQLILFIVPAVVLPVALAILAIGWHWRRHKRNNAHAPTDPTEDICILFTDIQSSTLLWAEVPHVMAPALDVHHAIIRKLIKKYKCYEVKTLGDSFMVASANPVAALQLALAIQADLYQESQAGIVDELYRAATNCLLTPEEYQRCWQGLRVRVGVHYGRAQITFDDTTKGYDYYGTVVNVAARIEGAAHGGQVLLSRQAFEPVADYCAANNVAMQPLGSVLLRGLPSPLDLVQVLPAGFESRTFPALRTDHSPTPDEQSNGDLEDGPFEDGCSLLYPQALDWEAANHSMVRSGTLSAELAKFHAYAIYYSLKYLLNMYENPDERRKRLKELCKQWHVECRVATEKQEDATVGRLALQLMGCVANQVHGKSKLKPTPTVHPVPSLLTLGGSSQLPGFSLVMSGENQATPMNTLPLPGLVGEPPEGERASSSHDTPRHTSSLSPQSGAAHLVATDDPDALAEHCASDAHHTEENEVSLGFRHPTPHRLRLADAAAVLGDAPRLAAERRGWLGNCRASVASGVATPQRLRSDSLLLTATMPLMSIHTDEPATLVEPSTPVIAVRRGWLANSKAFSCGSSQALLEPARVSRIHSAAVPPDVAVDGWEVSAGEDKEGHNAGEEPTGMTNPLKAGATSPAPFGLHVFEPCPSNDITPALFGVL